MFFRISGILAALICSLPAYAQERQVTETELCKGRQGCAKYFEAADIAKANCAQNNSCELVRGLKLYAEYCIFFPDDYVGKMIALPKRGAAQWVLGATETARFTHALGEIAAYAEQPAIYLEAQKCVNEVTSRLIEIVK